MTKFFLIQRGTFRDTGKSLTGPESIVNLDDMSSAEFEFGAVLRAYRRLLYHYEEYKIFRTEIYTPECDELLVFCNANFATEVTQAIREFIASPYELKKYSELEKIPHAKKGDTTYDRRHSNFWWCIDTNESYGNWIAFLQPQQNLFLQAVENDYRNRWLDMPLEYREISYRNSFRWY